MRNGGKVFLGKSFVLTWMVLDLWDSFAGNSPIVRIPGVQSPTQPLSAPLSNPVDLQDSNTNKIFQKYGIQI